ncbi:hypothetical protein ACFOET_09160 [Parapedobacter deserti]|uniref:Lipoprotein n=1 Tax=Parapedobacter deserti TaxID=1912957 RepID=A0ABV7JIA9_9SPHI
MSVNVHRLLIFALAVTSVSCGSDRTISERVALNEVAHYLQSNPVYETANMGYGEVKFNTQSDADLLVTYRQLEKGGYVTLERLEARKRFLSKDSTFVYLVKLTDKSIPFVIDKTDRKATVKTAEYTLDEDGGVRVEQSGKNRAKATVTLKKAETDFADFAPKGADNNASFAKKTYSLRFNSESGWSVTK